MFTLAGVTFTVEDIMNAALWAFAITMLIRMFSMYQGSIKVPMEITHAPDETANILKRYYTLFPKEMFVFDSKEIKRGMFIRVTTLRKKVFEGKLVGLNKDNIVCIVTQRNIIAQSLDDIEEIAVIE